MRASNPIQSIWETGVYVGDNRPKTFVTVEKHWQLTKTASTVGNYTKGPIRWWQQADSSQVETVVPNIKSVSIDRSIDSDAASCTIEIFNQKTLDPNVDTPIDGVFGDPGYYSWRRGESQRALDRFGQTENDWKNILIPDALIRTYQGYGGWDKTFGVALQDKDILMTGVWLVDTVSLTSDGIIVLQCRDMAKLLIEQRLYPPLVPKRHYPLRYCRWKHSVETVREEFDTHDRRTIYRTSSADAWYGENASIHGHRGTDSLDGDIFTYALSVGNGDPNAGYATDYWEYDVGEEINSVYVHPFMGNYTMYVSVMENGVWQGTVNVPYDISALEATGNPPWGVTDTGADIPYILQTSVPWEEPQTYMLDRNYQAERIRVSFRNPQLTQWGPNRYRSGIREVRARASTGTPGHTEERKLTSKTDGNMTDYCVDRETEILTRRGWLAYDEVKVGDFAWSLNPETRKAEWKPVTHLNIQHVVDKDMVSMEVHGHSSLTTKNHSWPVIADYGNKFVWTTTEEMNTNHNILYAAEPSGLPEEPAYSDEFVELVAWFWTEGWWGNNSGTNPVAHISQSTEYNPDNCERIERCLEVVYGPSGPMYSTKGGDAETVAKAVEMYRAGSKLLDIQEETGVTHHTVLKWHRLDRLPSTSRWAFHDYKNRGVRCYSLGRFSSEDFLDVCSVAPDKVVTEEFLLSLTRNQLELFIEVSLLGDGCVKATNSAWTQASIDRVRMFEMACVLSGKAFSTRQGKEKSIYNTTVRRYQKGKPQRSVHVVTYDGVIWCPEIQDNHSWLARRDGTCYFTGNSDVVSEILLWSGFFLFEDVADNGTPSVYGNLESTGIYPEECLNEDFFDKKPPIDVIKEITDIVGYQFWVDDEGGCRFESPNIWAPGNFLEDSSFTSEIIEIDEDKLLTNYSMEFSDDAIRSEIIIATEDPTAGFESTKVTRFTPQHANILRGMVRPAMWVNGVFTSDEERRIMAELIALRAFQSSRVVNIDCPANPRIQINDQIRLSERVASEVGIYYVRSVNYTHDVTTGEYTMSITAHFLGTDDDWVVTREDVGTGILDES